MTRRIVGSTCAAALLSIGVVAAQSAGQQSTPPAQPGALQTPAERGQTDQKPAPATATAAKSDQDVTVTGCVMREGVNDFVLSSASPAGGSGNVSAGVSGSTSSAAVGTSGSSTTTGASASIDAKGGSARSGRYMLSGGRDLATYVGQRVEITGHVDAASIGTSGTSTPGSSTTTPGAGVSARGGISDTGATASATATDRAGSTQHLTVSSVKAVSGACP